MEEIIMKQAIIRLAYVVVGYMIGLMTGVKFTSVVSEHRNVIIIAFVIIGMIIALKIESLAKRDSEKIFYLVMSFIFAIPLSFIFQYLGAVVVVLGKIIKAIKEIVFNIWFYC